MAEMEILDGSGHVTLTWNPEKADEVRRVEAPTERRAPGA